MFESLRRRERGPQMPNIEEEKVVSEKDKRDKLYEKKPVMLKKYQDLLDKFGPEKDWPEDVKENFHKEEKELDDVITETEGKEE